MGDWKVQNRRLRERLAGSDEWEEFEAESKAWPILGGLGNEDIYRTDHDGGFVGMSFRFFDPITRQWSIYWADSRRPGLLDPPVVGSFTGDTGVFEGDDMFKGRPIRVRFTWSRVTTPTPALGAGVLGRRRRDLGDELGQRLHARRRTRHERRRRRLPASDEGDRARAARSSSAASVLKWYDIAPADEPVPGPIRALARGTPRAAASTPARSTSTTSSAS